MSSEETSLAIGRPRTNPAAPTHVPGVNQGNKPKALRKADGFVPRPDGTYNGTARRSTSINPDARDPIDPRMPNLSPP